MSHRVMPGDIVIPHTKSVNYSQNSERWIGARGVVEKFPTATHGVQVSFEWPEHPDWAKARFVYWPANLELVSRPSTTVENLSKKLTRVTELAQKFSEQADQLKIEIEDAKKTGIDTRKPGQVWRRRWSRTLWLVRFASLDERKQGIRFPLVAISRSDFCPVGPGVNDSLVNVTDEDFLEQFEYVGTMLSLVRDATAQ